MKKNEVQEFSHLLSSLNVQERIALIEKTFPSQFLVSTSFGLQSVVLLHLIQNLSEKISVVFVDTGYLFPETYQYLETLKEYFSLDLKIYRSLMSSAHQEAIYGKLWKQGKVGLKKYSLLNKVEPMNRALEELGKKIWVSGIRRSHSQERKERPFAEIQGKTIKIYPILDWTDEQVEDYLSTHQLPIHPLNGKGYVSLGDWHSVEKIGSTGDREKTRFKGIKYECGLHEHSGEVDFQI